MTTLIMKCGDNCVSDLRMDIMVMGYTRCKMGGKRQDTNSERCWKEAMSRSFERRKQNLNGEAVKDEEKE
jgi:hypothetical protein